jgi:N-acetylglucosaminyldiphosphoundecaprenol N-acetyl-beta-D-mannosaminyltransferase
VAPRAITRLLGVAIDRAGLSDHLVRVDEALARRRSPHVFACANPHSLVIAQRDRAFRDALCSADSVVADGVGVIVAANMVRKPIGPRITGTDFFLATMRLMEARGGRVYFFGSTPTVLAQVCARVSEEFPRVVVCGSCSPPFGDWSGEEDYRMVSAINAAAPDVLWVGMTAPKQERWVQRNRAHLAVPVIGSIGAVFDYYAGNVRRAPEWACALGLEWLIRLGRDPIRLWRRTVVSAPRFLALVLRDAWFRPMREG